MDERNLAHSASGRKPSSADIHEITKLKEEHQKEIQKLTYESKIKLLETENEMRMKIVSLEKDNQTLTHHLEILKLKADHEIETKQVQADRELQNKLAEMEKQLAATKNEMIIKLSEKDKEFVTKENEYKMKIMEKDQEMLRKEKDFKRQIKDLENAIQMKVKDLENEHKFKLLEVTKEKDVIDRTLRHEIENLKTKNHQDEAEPKKLLKVQIVKPPQVFTKEEKLAWGADYFFGVKVMKWEENVFNSYENWYQGITRVLANNKQEEISVDGTNFVFIKKEFDQFHRQLFIGFKKKVKTVIPGYKEKNFDLMVEGLSEKPIEDGHVFLLHPKLPGKRLQFGSIM